MRLRVQTRFSFRNGLQLRNDPVFIVIKPDAQVHFIGARIFFETLHQRQNRVARIGVNFLKHAEVLLVYGVMNSHNKPEPRRDRGEMRNL